MKKILVLGSSGAGKSTFAKRLHETLAIDIVHLDQHYWKPGWERTEDYEWRETVASLLGKQQWIMDGNYRDTFDLRLPEADTLVFLDTPMPVCLFRFFKRRFKRDRVDDIQGCGEHVTFQMMKWIIWTFPRKNRKEILQVLHDSREGKDMFILKSDRDVEKFFRML